MSLSFLFVQFEFTHAVGPHAARYIVKSDNAGTTTIENPALDARNHDVAGTTHSVGGADVLTVGIIGAPAGQRIALLRRARPVRGEGDTGEVPLSILTFIEGSAPIASQREADRLLGEIRVSADAQESWIRRGLETVNLAIRAHRICAPEPYAIDVTRRDPRAIRIGHGTTEQVQEGRWSEAIDIPRPPGGKVNRIQRLRPAEAVAAVLSGRHRLFEAEDLLVRTLLDLDHGRSRAAAHQAGAAMRLLRAELSGADDLDGLDLHGLAEHSRRTLEIAELADAGPLDDDTLRELGETVDATIAAIDLWRVPAPTAV